MVSVFLGGRVARGGGGAAYMYKDTGNFLDRIQGSAADIQLDKPKWNDLIKKISRML